MNVKNILLLASLVIFSLILPAQQTKIDSLLNLEKEAENDESTVRLYLNIGRLYRDRGELDLAKEYYRKAEKLSEKIDDKSGYFHYLRFYSDILMIEGKMDSSLIICHDILNLAMELKDEAKIAQGREYIGVIYAELGSYEISQEYLYEALKYYEEKEDLANAGQTYNSISANYAEMQLWPQATETAEKAVELTKEHSSRHVYSLVNLGVCYYKGQPRQHEKAEATFLEILEILEKEPNIHVESYVQINLGGIYKNLYQLEKSEFHVKRALELAQAINHPVIICEATLGLGFLRLYKNDYEKAEEYAKAALDIAIEYEIWINEHKALEFLGDLCVFKRNFENMNFYYAAADSVQQLIRNDMIRTSVEELSIKYETEKKDIQIAALAKEKRLFFILMIAGCVLILFALAILIYRNRLHRRHEQLLAAQVALESESAERSRLAKDLHDGLGGMLSLVKINLNDVKGMKIMEHEDAGHFDKALDMLDNSITELRRLAHHIMPESLIKNGLKTSLEDFAAAVPGAGFHFYGTEKRLDNNLEVVLYRSAHELVNNALKHSSANHINIQLVQERDRISLTVVDNGKGFDQKQETKGAGLKNIRNRIAIYDGEMHVFSDSQSGTEINIEIPLKE